MKIGALEWNHVSGYAAIIAGQGLVEKTDLSLVRHCPIPGYINAVTPDYTWVPYRAKKATCVLFEFKLDHSISQSSSQQ
jgi:Na+-translocating ferredoxin:NAD+ oxidoreductase RnfC subunit